MKKKFSFQKATREALKGRVALIGPSGSGKTWTALSIAEGLAGDGGRVAVIDTENKSARKYSDRFSFDVLELESFEPLTYVEAIHAAEEEGFDALVIDSLSHAWIGKGGALEQVDNAAKRSKGNSFAAWREVTPQHNALVEALVRCKCHLIVTMRSRTEYVIEQNERGRATPRKVGMAPQQREGLEYEMDVVGELDLEHNLVITKSRCFTLADKVLSKPDDRLGRQLRTWLDEGAAPAPVEDIATVFRELVAELVARGGLPEADAKAQLWGRAGELARQDRASERRPEDLRRAAAELAESQKDEERGSVTRIDAAGALADLVNDDGPEP